MKQETIISGIVGLILGALIAPIFMPMMPWGGQMMYRNSMMSGNQIMGGIDSHFIEQMIPHHEDAITMANLATTRAEHPEIKTLANDIIKAQSEEIDQMKLWYKAWFGNEVPDVSYGMGSGMGMMMHGDMMGDEAYAKTLEKAKPFDKEFIEQMIPHHQMAVMMAQMLSRSTNRAEMKQLAESIILAQTKEINQMREWYRAWYEN
jgi:uncharacterized protein (DUF305 family)